MIAADADWLAAQRWFAGKAARAAPGATRTTVLDGGLEISLLEVDASHYQLVSRGEGPDSLDDPATGAALVGALCGGTRGSGPAGTVTFHLDARADVANRTARPVGVEQSNSSLIVDDRWILKVFRRIVTGTNPELEVLRFLNDRGAANVPSLAGWYEITGGPVDGTLGVIEGLVPDALDGWNWMLQRLPWQPEETIEPLHRLGAVIASLHGTLADPSHEAFGTSGGGPALAHAIAGGITADARRVAASLPAGHDHVRRALEDAARSAAELSEGLDAGPAQRVHGDLHLGQLLVGEGAWTVIDWEGEPSRSIEERRAHQPALRDVAGLLRSLSYVVAAAERTASVRPLHGWHAAARASLLDGYLSTADPRLLPIQPGATRRLLRLLELEKIVYEVGYEAANRPGWLDIPVGALLDLTTRHAA